MATEAQIEANRKNATASTGPNTPEGKSKSSRNAVSHRLFSSRDILNPGDDPEAASEFSELAAGMRKDLAPEGTLEQSFAKEITRAAWRLRRCASVEDNLSDQAASTDLDPMADPASAPTQIAVDRARAEAHRILKRSMDALRQLQNERRFRFEILHEGVDTGDLGLASYKDLMPAMVADKRWRHLKRQEEGLGSFQSMLEIATAPPEASAPIAPVAPIADTTKRTQSPPESPQAASTKQTHSVPNTARNAPCPCGSGQKYKRCCGKNAAPVLYSAAA